MPDATARPLTPSPRRSAAPRLPFAALAVAVAGSIAVGCGGGDPPKIDASSDAALEASLGAIIDRMTTEEMTRFVSDCSNMTYRPPGDAGPDGRAPSQAGRYRPLHGLTAAEVHAKAEQFWRDEQADWGRRKAKGRGAGWPGPDRKPPPMTRHGPRSDSSFLE